MIKTNYNVIPDQLFSNYLRFLINKIFKILPMQEEKNPDLKKYIESLQRELVGNIRLIKTIRYDGDFLSLLGKIEFLIYNHSNHKILKKEVFECISIIEKLQDRYDLK